MTKQDIDDCIFKPLGKQKELEPFVGDGTIYYTLKGFEEDEIDGLPVVYDHNSKVIFAKKIIKRGTPTFWVRISKNGRFYNHLSIDGEKILRKKSYDKAIENRFVEINERAFDLYCKFLVTKNKRYLKSSEKEVI